MLIAVIAGAGAAFSLYCLLSIAFSGDVIYGELGLMLGVPGFCCGLLGGLEHYYNWDVSIWAYAIGFLLILATSYGLRTLAEKAGVVVRSKSNEKGH